MCNVPKRPLYTQKWPLCTQKGLYALARDLYALKRGKYPINDSIFAQAIRVLVQIGHHEYYRQSDWHDLSIWRTSLDQSDVTHLCWSLIVHLHVLWRICMHQVSSHWRLHLWHDAHWLVHMWHDGVFTCETMRLHVFICDMMHLHVFTCDWCTYMWHSHVTWCTSNASCHNGIFTCDMIHLHVACLIT